MTPDEIEQMQKDIEAGTPGPWGYAPTETADVSHLIRDQGGQGIAKITDSFGLPVEENARRIARVPQLEAEVMRLRRVIFEAQQLGEAGMLDEMLATIDGAFLNGVNND